MNVAIAMAPLGQPGHATLATNEVETDTLSVADFPCLNDTHEVFSICQAGAGFGVSAIQASAGFIIQASVGFGVGIIQASADFGVCVTQASAGIRVGIIQATTYIEKGIRSRK